MKKVLFLIVMVALAISCKPSVKPSTTADSTKVVVDSTVVVKDSVK